VAQQVDILATSAPKQSVFTMQALVSVALYAIDGVGKPWTLVIELHTKLQVLPARPVKVRGLVLS